MLKQQRIVGRFKYFFLAKRPFFLIFLITAFFVQCTHKKTEELETKLTVVNQALKASSEYLQSMLKEDGMFVYRINMNPNVNFKNKYNILRHAGTIYALSMYNEMSPDVNIQHTIKKAAAYLRDKALFPVKGHDSLWAIWSIPEINGGNNPLTIKLGGTGLGLIALLCAEKIEAGFTPLDKLRALGKMIQFMQKEDGSFYSKYVPSEGGLTDKWVSLYYPGEAALAMVMLYEKDHSELWFQTAYRALEYLAQSRQNSTNIPADHWALLATKKILANANSNNVPIDKNLLINHSLQICNTMLGAQVNDPRRPDYDGGFNKNGTTCATATRLEGLLATLSFLPNSHPQYQEIRNSIDRGMSFLLNSQISEGQFIGAFPRAIGPLDGNRRMIVEFNFNQRATEVRIDYVQHAMSAMVNYNYILRSELH